MTRQPAVGRSALLRWSALVSLAGGLLAWWVVVLATGLPRFVLPGPADVVLRLIDYLPSGQLPGHVATTLLEVLLGGVVGTLFGLLSGLLLAGSRVADRLFGPYLVASQSIPMVAISPLLMVWFGPGLLSKAIVCAVVVFFPMTISTMVGLRSTDPRLIELLRSIGASRLQTLRLLELPSALPSIFGGLKLAGSLAIVGAVVGEFIGARAGLGFLVNYAALQLDTPLLFVGLLALVGLGLAMFAAIGAVERRVLGWRRAGLTHAGEVGSW